jgi:hypothetical protein
MSTVLDPRPTSAPRSAVSAVATTDPHPALAATPPPSRLRRNGWALWGAAAFVGGLIATVLTANPAFDDYQDVDRVVSELDAGTYHVGLVVGFLTVACMLVTAAGWRRFLSERAPRSLAGRVLPMALTATATVMIVAYGLKGTMADYLPGGAEGDYNWNNVGLYSIYMVLDFLPWIAGWGVCIAAGAAAHLGLRERQLPRWLGWVSLFFFVAPAVVMSISSVPGIPFMSTPWLLIASIAMAARRVDDAPVSA